jgi:hypothetical protein
MSAILLKPGMSFATLTWLLLTVQYRISASDLLLLPDGSPIHMPTSYHKYFHDIQVSCVVVDSINLILINNRSPYAFKIVELHEPVITYHTIKNDGRMPGSNE